MGRLAHIRYKILHCVLLVLILLGFPTAALAGITPLKLTLNEDQSVSLLINGKTTPLQLNQTFTHNTPTPFHVKGTVGGKSNQRIALTVHEWPTDIVGSFNMDGQWYQIETNTSAIRHLGSLAADSDLIAIQPDVNMVGDAGKGAIDKVLRHQSLTKKPLAKQPLTKQASNKTFKAAPNATELLNEMYNNNRALTTRTTTRAIRVGIIVDSLFNDHHSGRGLARARAIMNGVDAILQNELGLAVEVVSVIDYTNPATDPFRQLEPSIDTTLMPALQAERVRNNDLAGNLSLVHLFSGHLDQNTRTLVGLGWLNSVCNANGFDVSLSSPFLFDTLLAAHEIMHNLGAPHDNSEQCEAYAGVSDDYLMWSNINGNTSNRLSSCSVDTARTSLAADCTVDAIDLSVGITLATQANTTSHELRILVHNTDSARTANDVTTHTTLPFNTVIQAIPVNCQLNDATISCLHEPISSSQQSQVQLLIDTDSSTDYRIRSELTLANDVDHNLVNNVAIIDIPDIESFGSDLVTVSSNATSVGPDSPSNFAITSNTNAPLNSLAQASTSESTFSRFGAPSLGLIWALLLQVVYRLVLTINRIKRNRL